eukprot:7138870-Lingulodinium_polyedra.AAC.1
MQRQEGKERKRKGKNIRTGGGKKTQTQKGKETKIRRPIPPRPTRHLRRNRRRTPDRRNASVPLAF